MANVVTLSLAKLSNPFAAGLYGDTLGADKFSLSAMQYSEDIENTPLMAPLWMGNYSPVPLTSGPTAPDSVLDCALKKQSQ